MLDTHLDKLNGSESNSSSFTKRSTRRRTFQLGQLNKERTSPEKRNQHFVTRRTEWSWVQTQLLLHSIRRLVAPPVGRQSRPTKKSEHKIPFFQKNTITSSTGQRHPLMKTTIADKAASQHYHQRQDNVPDNALLPSRSAISRISNPITREPGASLYTERHSVQ